MNDATYEANALFVTSRWLPEHLAERVRRHAACLMNLSAGALTEIADAGDIDTSDSAGIQQPILFALALGYDWARQVTRAPLRLEEPMTLAAMGQLLPLFEAGPDAEMFHSTYALRVYRDVSQLWHDSLDQDSIEAILDERARIVSHIPVEVDEDLALPLWFDIGVAHAHFQRVLVAKAAAEDLDAPPPTLDPIAWMLIMDPSVFDDGGRRAREASQSEARTPSGRGCP